MKKDHLEIILERMDSKFDLVIESQDAVNKKIDNVQASLDEHIQENKKDQRLILQMIKEVSQETKDVRKELHQETKGIRKELAELRQENELAHKEILSGIKLSYSELDTRIKNLEQGFSSLNQRLSRLEAARA